MSTRCCAAASLLAALVLPGACGRVGYGAAVAGLDADDLDANDDATADGPERDGPAGPPEAGPPLDGGEAPDGEPPDAAADRAPSLPPDDGPSADSPVQDASVPDDGPMRVSPRFRCGYNLGEDDNVAVWGALSAYTLDIDIPVGPDNYFFPAPQNRGQVTRFPSGNIELLFVTRSRESNLVWVLTARTATMNIPSAPCTLSPDMREIILPSGARVPIPPPPP